MPVERVAFPCVKSQRSSVYTMYAADEGTAGESVKSETELIAQGLRRRDVALLQSLVERYQHRLLRYLLYLLGRFDGVEDLVQETWLRVLERGASYDGRSRFEPWLFTIARHLAMDEMRKRRTVSLDSHEDTNWPAKSASTIASTASPFALAAQTEDAERLAHCLGKLEPVYREALILRFQEHLSMKEIAEVAGAPVSTIAARIYRSLAVLREQLEGVNHEV